MPKLIKDGAIAHDRWTLLKEATGPEVLQVLLGKNLIVPLRFWKEYRQELNEYSGEIAVWLNSDEDVAEIADHLPQLSLVALNFPVFSDGRSYSNARALRQRYDYQGEIRAIGDVARDQLFYMSRCGFDAFELRYDQDEELCLQAFNDFKTTYTSTVTEPLPLFKRR